MTHELVVLLDVDNTLLDNDALIADLNAHLVTSFGADEAARYWAGFEALRAEQGYADYLSAVQRFRVGASDEAISDPRMLQLSAMLLDYPFADRLYPGALDTVAQLSRFGPTVILSDGDAVFQPRKVQRSGLWQAVEGRVLIYVHKERMLPVVSARYPARHYVMVDDKRRVLSAMKAAWGERLTTVFPRQGHYAAEAQTDATRTPPDLTIERIDALLRIDQAALLGAAPE